MAHVHMQAGGWLGRVYLLDWGVQGVDRFVSLGSPHQPPPQVTDSSCVTLVMYAAEPSAGQMP
jgi:hypothetical protein